jgi:hypothetical protein
MDLALRDIVMDKHMLAHMKKIDRTEKESIFGQMAIITKASSQMVFVMGLDFSNSIKIILSFEEIIEMIKNVDMDN